MYTLQQFKGHWLQLSSRYCWYPLSGTSIVHLVAHKITLVIPLLKLLNPKYMVVCDRKWIQMTWALCLGDESTLWEKSHCLILHFQWTSWSLKLPNSAAILFRGLYLVFNLVLFSGICNARITCLKIPSSIWSTRIWELLVEWNLCGLVRPAAIQRAWFQLSVSLLLQDYEAPID
jgi:hypothetical protein